VERPLTVQIEPDVNARLDQGLDGLQQNGNPLRVAQATDKDDAERTSVLIPAADDLRRKLVVEQVSLVDPRCLDDVAPMRFLAEKAVAVSPMSKGGDVAARDAAPVQEFADARVNPAPQGGSLPGD